jgi:ABC-type transporter Mla subunit MlaD
MAKSPTELLAEFAPGLASLNQRLDSFEKTQDALSSRSQANADLVTEIKSAVAVLKQQLETVNQTAAQIGSLHDANVMIAVLRRDVDELRKTKDATLQRIYMIAAPIVGAVVGYLLNYYYGK